jgi:retron-type reverse transcriptase
MDMSRRNGSYPPPAFRDRVVQHALVSVIEPIVEKKFVKDTFACIAGRGTHIATRHTLSCCHAAKRTCGAYYALKRDISGFFPGVNHGSQKNPAPLP